MKVLTCYRCVAIMDKKPQKKNNKGDTEDENCCFWQNGIYGYDEHGHDDVHVFCDVHMYFAIVLRDFFIIVNQTARRMRAVFCF